MSDWPKRLRDFADNHYDLAHDNFTDYDAREVADYIEKLEAVAEVAKELDDYAYGYPPFSLEMRLHEAIVKLGEGEPQSERPSNT